MKYPSGKDVCKHDIIWMDEGLWIVRVVNLYESEEDWPCSLYQGPCIEVAANIFGNPEQGSYIVPESFFEEDGIEPLSREEELLVKCLCVLIQSQTGMDLSDSKYGCHPWRYPIRQEDGSYQHTWIINIFETGRSNGENYYFLLNEETMMFQDQTRTGFESITEGMFFYSPPACTSEDIE